MAPQKLALTLLTIMLLVSGLPVAEGSANSADLEPVPLPVWRNEMVASGVESHSALALDSAGVAHILYHNTSAEELYWAYANGDGWETELVAEVSPSDLELAIALDAQDRPHIAYVDGAAGQLVVGLRQAGNWLLEPIAPGGQQLSLAVGSDAIPQLILVQDKQLVYWTKQQDVWVSELVGTPVYGMWNPRLVLDGEDRAHVAFTPGIKSIYSIRQAANNWAVESLEFELVEDLALGPDGNPNLLFSEVRVEHYGRYPFFFYQLKLAERSSDGWAVEQISEVYFSYTNARLAVGPTDRKHIVFRDELNRYVYRQRGEGVEWLFERPVWPGKGDTSLAVAPDGEPLLLTHADRNLLLSNREILWLDKFSLLPAIAR